jgi:hypothetical protein
MTQTDTESVTYLSCLLYSHVMLAVSLSQYTIGDTHFIQMIGIFNKDRRQDTSTSTNLNATRFFKRFGCPPGIRTPICCSRGSCPTIERGGSKDNTGGLAAVLAKDQRVPDRNRQLIHDKCYSGQGQTTATACGKALAQPPTTRRAALPAGAIRECGNWRASPSPWPELKCLPAQ